MSQIDPDADAPGGDEMTGEERSGRGPSRMSEGRFIITEVNSVGEPTRPKVVLGPFKTAIECLVRDHVAITYRVGETGEMTCGWFLITSRILCGASLW